MQLMRKDPKEPENMIMRKEYFKAETSFLQFFKDFVMEYEN